MSEAHARMHLREYVNDVDVNLAIQTCLFSFIATQKYSVQRTLQRKFKRYLSFQQVRALNFHPTALNLHPTALNIHPTDLPALLCEECGRLYCYPYCYPYSYLYYVDSKGFTDRLHPNFGRTTTFSAY
eukprot:137732-Prorocentrum_minimum.AAC.1